ncbi:peptidoglycan-binding protein [Rhizobiales bacterium]|uniref:peptidoglycan-binding protein n=1 Tax=Hongsoonwoonella zoysiae TaxID=2821844 RepID=UPI0015600521|nr:peptidoglycan-binding protein [Hongsoonwoonella zoysiae]
MIGEIRRQLGDEASLPLPIRARRDDLSAFYHGRDSTPLWIGTNNIPLLLARMERSAFDGLPAGSYPLSFLRETGGNTDTASKAVLARIELLFSAHFLRFAEDIKVGRVVPRMVYPSAYMPRKPVDGANVLRALMQLGDLADFFEAWEPYNPTYRALRRHLTFYRLIDLQGGFKMLAPGPEIGAGAKGPRVAALRRRLALEGLLDTSFAGANEPFDAALADALRKAQARYGISPTGRLDRQTTIAFNIPIERRVEQIELAMERQRWLPELIQGVALLVDKQQNLLQFIENGRVRATIAAYPNCPDRNAAINAGSLREVTVNPVWRVPADYISDELLEELRTEPAALEKRGYSMRIDNASAPLSAFPWPEFSNRDIAARQDDFDILLAPGAENPLGRFRIRFTNGANLFLFDIPRAPEAHDYCNPYLPASGFGLVEGLGLLANLVDPRVMPVNGFEDLVKRGETITFQPRDDAMVIVIYQSAWITEDGDIRFGHDAHGEDRRLREALLGRSTG